MMRIQLSTILALPVALAALSYSANAQGNSHGNAKAKGHATVQADAHARVQAQQPPPPPPGNPHSQGNDHKASAQENSNGHASDRAQRADNNGRAELRDNGRNNNGPVIVKQQIVSRGDVALAGPRVVYFRPLTIATVRPAVRTYVISTRPREHIVGSAVAYAFARGVPERTFVLVPVGSRFAVRNRTGATLVMLDDNDAMRLGAFRVVPLATEVRGNAPAFCRSGAGHPVWGRQWCLDKGFGLGTSNNIRWGRLIEPTTVYLQPTPVQTNVTAMIAAEVLRSVLGATTYDRLALHALTLGYSDPLVGRWIGEPTGPRTLLVNSGVYPVAEIVDTNRDNRADNLIVALRPW
jgi:hypothetical protein